MHLKYSAYVNYKVEVGVHRYDLDSMLWLIVITILSLITLTYTYDENTCISVTNHESCISDMCDCVWCWYTSNLSDGSCHGIGDISCLNRLDGKPCKHPSERLTSVIVASIIGCIGVAPVVVAVCWIFRRSRGEPCKCWP